MAKTDTTPPMSTTSLPSDVESIPPPSNIAPPVLASDILRQELAPIAPAKQKIRIGLVAFAVLFGAFAATWYLGFAIDKRGAAHGSMAAAAIALVLALVPISYAWRAGLAAVLGGVLILTGCADLGPLQLLYLLDPSWGPLAIAILATLLPAALLFRDRYRALPIARVTLACALGASAPAFVRLAGSAIGGADPFVRVADGALAIAALSSLLGFMGAETTAGCKRWAWIVLVANAVRGPVGGVESMFGRVRFPLTVGANDAEIAAHVRAEFVTDVLAIFATTSLVAFALFQLLAVAYAKRAQAVDVHQLADASAAEADDPAAFLDDTAADHDAEESTRDE